MIAIIDYGMGNLRSVQKAFEKIGVHAIITADRSVVESADRVVLPGVGAISDAMTELDRRGLIDVIHQVTESGRPFLGICLGFQLLFEQSEENGGCHALGILPGQVVRFQLKRPWAVPHMGWNQITIKKETPLTRGIRNGEFVYFVHSYYAQCGNTDDLALETDYAFPFCSAVARKNVFGTQFHPEKSQSVGLTLLKNFAGMDAVKG